MTADEYNRLQKRLTKWLNKKSSEVCSGSAKVREARKEAINAAKSILHEEFHANREVGK